MNAKIWSKETVIADALKYTSVSEWRKNSSSAYAICCRNKWNDEACAHMQKKKEANGFWSDEKVLTEAKKYSTTAEWALSSPSSYSVAKRRKLVPSTMPRALIHNQWSKSQIEKVANECKTRGEFKSTYPSAYSIAIDKGWLEDVCAHMLSTAPWFGPRVIREYLISHDINFIAEYKFKDNSTVKNYPFDFYLPEFKMVIEYQGRQHKVGWFNDQDDAMAIQLRDEVKRTFAIANGLNYLELDQTTKKTLTAVLDAELRKLAKDLVVQLRNAPRELTASELKGIETPFKWSSSSVKDAIDSCKSIKEFRRKESKNEQLYYCPNKERDWVNKGGTETPWERDKGCGMSRSLNIPETDRLVWDAVIDTHKSSTILKEEVKWKILEEAGAPLARDQEEIKVLERQLKQFEKMMKQLKESQANLLLGQNSGEIKADVYKIALEKSREQIHNLEIKIANTQIQIKGGNDNKKWVDWLKIHGQNLDKKKSLSDIEKKQYLMGLIEKISVKYDKDKNIHEVVIKFQLPVVGDSVIWKNPANHKEGYKVKKGKLTKSVVVKKKDPRWAKMTPQRNHSITVE